MIRAHRMAKTRSSESRHVCIVLIDGRLNYISGYSGAVFEEGFFHGAFLVARWFRYILPRIFRRLGRAGNFGPHLFKLAFGLEKDVLGDGAMTAVIHKDHITLWANPCASPVATDLVFEAPQQTMALIVGFQKHGLMIHQGQHFTTHSIAIPTGVVIFDKLDTDLAHTDLLEND